MSLSGKRIWSNLLVIGLLPGFVKLLGFESALYVNGTVHISYPIMCVEPLVGSLDVRELHLGCQMFIRFPYIYLETPHLVFFRGLFLAKIDVECSQWTCCPYFRDPSKNKNKMKACFFSNTAWK